MIEDAGREYDFYAADPDQQLKGLEVLITSEIKRNVTELISSYIQLQGLKLSAKAHEQLSLDLALLYVSPWRGLQLKSDITNKQKKLGIRGVIIEELNRLMAALNYSESTALEIATSLYFSAKEMDLTEADMAYATKYTYRLSPFILKTAVYDALNRLAISEPVESLYRKSLPDYFTKSVRAYEQTILKENPTAGFSYAESASLHNFMIEVVTLMEPDNENPESGLKGKIQKALDILSKTPSNQRV